ncbi:DUF4007 family protein [Kangiella sediminilitoris]|uniref:DUF4007 domain-containing protein n=1 Tax=Kangiella sediminilitoris TaxID=1144748 RepID=A0A1B3B9P1_9GAMM|nr:DUF4007 family protein [Kangiella sediminilitoris]AOE49510.1 hypothetical protein KS2013_786 [Kangiella sediminilitoris]
MKFNKNRVAFGRHESFALRYGWLTKGYNALVFEPNFFKSEDATTVLGVGKNMVNAIKYWLTASQLINDNKQEPTTLGKLIFDKEKGYDPYLEDEATIWLIHWLLASNAENSTAIFWFFNKFHKAGFTGLEVQTALKDFVKDQVETKVSATTLKNDAQLVLRMYTPSKANAKTPVEEALDSPLSLLRLIGTGSSSKHYLSKPEEREHLPLGVLGFAVTKLMKDKGVSSLPIEDLMYAKDDFAAPGAIFRLTENALVTKLEQLVNYLPGKLTIRETAGIHQLYILDDKIKPVNYLSKHYKDSIKGVAA